jgi:hypothetical protein
MTELYERIPIEQLNLLRKMSIDDYIKFADKKKYKINEIKDHYNQIMEYVKDHIKCKGVMKKVYKYSESSENGRLYGMSSIQNLDGIIRGFLFGSTTTDFDMKNAHPHILEYICRVRDIRCPNLSEYINNRDAIVSKLKMVGIADPKFEILKMLNTEKTSRITNDCDNILKGLRDELKNIRVRLKQESDFVEQLQQAMIYKPKNIEGSFVNRILCIYENKMMNTMASYIHSKNLEIAEYAFDGILVYGDFYDKPEMLQEMTDYVNEEFPDLNITLTMKQHSKAISSEYLENLDELDEVLEHETYEFMKTDFEKTHCKIINKSMFIKEYNGRPCFMNRKNLMDAYEHLNFKDKDNKKVSFITIWLKDEHIRKYTDVDTFPPPLTCPNDIYNLWIPFDMENVTDWEEKDITIFLNHIKILCNHEKETYDYFINWISQMIQYPSTKTTMILFQGGEGCGKGRLFSIIEKLVGSNKYFETSCPERDIWGHFNPKMANSFFVHLSELSKKQTQDSENKIKALVTDPALEINQKGKDTISTTSFHRFVVASNDDEPMNTHKGDRRKLLISSSNELKGNVEYFNELSKCINDVNYIKSFYEYLKAIPDMDKFNMIPIPMTEYQKLLCELAITPIESFIKDMVSECEEEEIVITSKDLFDKFKTYLHESKTNYEVNIVKFGVRLSNLKLNGVSTIHGKKCNSKKFDIAILKKHFGIGCLL